MKVLAFSADLAVPNVYIVSSVHLNVTCGLVQFYYFLNVVYSRMYKRKLGAGDDLCRYCCTWVIFEVTGNESHFKAESNFSTD